MQEQQRPPYNRFNSADRFVSQMRKCCDAFQRIGNLLVDPAPKLCEQLSAYHDAVILIHDKTQDIVDPQHVYMPCELTNALIKEARRDKKFRDALKLVGITS